MPTSPQPVDSRYGGRILRKPEPPRSSAELFHEGGSHRAASEQARRCLDWRWDRAGTFLPIVHRSYRPTGSHCDQPLRSMPPPLERLYTSQVASDLGLGHLMPASRRSLDSRAGSGQDTFRRRELARAREYPVVPFGYSALANHSSYLHQRHPVSALGNPFACATRALGFGEPRPYGVCDL
jgi:hypothetical protein